jgi:hypothetical protein
MNPQDRQPKPAADAAAPDPLQQDQGLPGAGPAGRSTTGNLSAENPRSWKPSSNPHAGETIATQAAREAGLDHDPELTGRDPQRADSGNTPQAFDEAAEGLQPETGRDASRPAAPRDRQGER